jgi:predicted Fe-S protein YdhL (DUF1289 family)
MKFIPCKGSAFCTETGTHCEGCGRSHSEIAETRRYHGLKIFTSLKLRFQDFQRQHSQSLLKII